jgi:anaerobic ribonucleoside-triphosphate reductase
VPIQLTDDQRRIVEHTARERGETCPQCGSADLRCADAHKVLGGYMFNMWCQNTEAHPGWVGAKHGFELSNDDVQFFRL